MLWNVVVAGPGAAPGVVGVWAPPERWLACVDGETVRDRTGPTGATIRCAAATTTASMVDEEGVEPSAGGL